jgi:DNA adenine methylase
MDTYDALASDCLGVSRRLSRLASLNSEELYYATRLKYNAAKRSTSKAAAFIYLNRTCFNGIFRVNKRGEFNVPYGYKAQPLFPTSRELRAAAELLRKATLRCCDYSEALARPRRGDFVYLDPPYPPLNGTSYFAHYTADRFPFEEQEALAKSVYALLSRGVRFMMSNADTPVIQRLYKRFPIARLTVARPVTCKNVKHSVSELVITNY